VKEKYCKQVQCYVSCPEGGLTPEEAALAQEHGVQVVTLGTRILRAETAALATVATIVYELGL